MNNYLELLTIPISAGVVGYATNALAIRMLFRPFKPHWYTLGWQGIIPRTREILAANVGKTVGEKLVTATEIDRALSDPQMVEKLRLAIYDTIHGGRVDGKLKLAIESFIVPLLQSSLSDPQIAHTIDVTAANIAKSILNTALNVKRHKVAEILLPFEEIDNNASMRNTLCFNLEKLLRDEINNVAHSGKSLSELLPNLLDIEYIAKQLSDQVIPIVGKLFSNPDVADTLSEIFIKYKSEQFGDSIGDRMKLAAINVFLYDDRIHELTREKLPEVGAKIEQDAKIRKIILRTISDKLSEFLNTPIALILDTLGKDKFYLLLHELPRSIVHKAVPERITHRLLELLRGDNEEMTLSELLEGVGVSADTMIAESLPLSDFLKSPSTISRLRNGIEWKLSKFQLTDEQADSVSKVAAEWLIHLLRTLIPHFIKLVNITSLVEQKINELDLAEVEDLLFSFMKSHFKWINILGFVIGFLVGAAQAGFLLLSSLKAQ